MMTVMRTKAGTASRKTCPLSAKYAEARSLYERGLSLAQVAAFYGCTRQGMWDILKRRGTVMRPQRQIGPENHFYRKGPTANDYAQNALEYAIRKGIVTKRNACEKCGATPVFKDGRSGVQAHHCDYNKPLDVMWLCQRCHHEWHRNNRATERRN
jgi:hypothetical protein